MRFGLPICPLGRAPAAEAALMLIIHINWADLPSNNEAYKQHKVMLEVHLLSALSQRSSN